MKNVMTSCIYYKFIQTWIWILIFITFWIRSKKGLASSLMNFRETAGVLQPIFTETSTFLPEFSTGTITHAAASPSWPGLLTIEYISSRKY